MYIKTPFIEQIKKSIISYFWPILALIFVTLLLDSCSSSRSVRYNEPYSVKSKTKNSEADKKEQSKEQDNTKNKKPKINSDVIQSTFYNDSEREKYLQDKKSNPENKNQNDNNVQGDSKLLSLNEQVKRIYEEQKTIDNKVNNLQQDVTDMKSSIEDIKTAVNSIIGNKAISGVKGSTSKPAKKHENIDEDSKTDDGTILSDEEVKEKDNTNSDTPKKKIKLTNTKKKSKDNTKVKPQHVNNTSKSKETKTENQDNTENKVQTQPNSNNLTDDKNNAEKPNIEIAVSKMRHKDFSEAINIFNNIMKSEKNPVVINECNYWLGESNFGLKKYNEAIDYFSKVLHSGKSARQDDAQIMIAESFIRIGKVADAKQSFQALIVKYPNSQFVPRARKMLQLL